MVAESLTAAHNERRIAVLGLGAMGRRVLQSLQSHLLPDAAYAALEHGAHVTSLPGVQAVATLEQLLDWKPQLVVECAGHSAVGAYAPALLAAGVDVMLVSVGALAQADLRETLQTCARDGGGRLMTVSGAIGGLDALDAARSAGLQSVRYTGRKPPMAWTGTPAEQVHDLGQITQATVIFEGTAGESALRYPKNANVTAAVALAGAGFDRTEVRLVADPEVQQNVHELEVKGAFGQFQIRLENSPLPDNPKTSWLAALSIEAELRRYLGLDYRHPV